MGNEISNDNNELYNAKQLLDRNKYINSYGKMMISLNKISYKPGEYIFGNIFLKLDNNFNSNEIRLVFQGYEEVLYFHPIGSYEVKQCYEKNLKYNNSYIIKKINQEFIEAGDYIFSFKILWDNNLLPTYNKEYIDDENKAYTRVKYLLIAYITRDLNFKNSIVSNEIELFIDTNVNLNYQIIDTIDFSKFCQTILLIKGILKYSSGQDYIFGNEDNTFILELNSLRSKIKIDDINLELINYCDIKTNLEKKDFKKEIIFKKSFGGLEPKTLSKFEFKLKKNIININQPTIISENINQNYYFKIKLLNWEKKIKLKLIFPLWVKNGNINNINFDNRFFYYSGNKNIFLENFNPKMSLINDLSSGNFEENNFLLTNFQKKEMINNIVKKNGKIIFNQLLNENNKEKKDSDEKFYYN